MESPIVGSILKKLGLADLLDKLANQLSGSQWQSLLLAVFQERSKNLKPAQILHNYLNNRFVNPVTYSMIDFMAADLLLLQSAESVGFKVLELSPVSPFGTCSSMAKVDQNKVLSASRGVEVMADATNALALEAACQRKSKRQFSLDLATSHRHIRTQNLNFPGYTAHFRIFCAISAGRDQGSFAFETNSMLKHLGFYLNYFIEEQKIPLQQIKICWLKANTVAPTGVFEALCAAARQRWPQLEQEEGSSNSGAYYQEVQCKIYLKNHEQWMDLVDMGLTNWTQQLLEDRKERLWISGMGTELFFKHFKKNN